MTDALHAAAGLCLCLLTGSRVRMLRGSVTSRSLWVALAVLGVCQVLQVQAVYRGLEQGMRLPGAPALLIHGLTVVAAAATLELHASLDPARAPGADRRHRWWACATLALMVVLYAWAPPAVVPPALAHRSEFYDRSPAVSLAWAAYLAYLSWALTGMRASTRRFAVQAPPGPLRTGLRLGTAGVTVGYGYVALKVGVVGLWLAGSGPSSVRVDATAEAAVLSCTLLLIGTGSAYEVLAAHAGRVRAAAAHRRSLRRLAPLARVLRAAAPYSAYRLPARGGRQRLILRVTEIRDGQRALRAFVDPAVAQAAAAAAQRAGHAPSEVPALAEACALELGRRAKAVGSLIRPSALTDPAGGRDLAEEVRCLEQLATAYRHPFIRRYVDTLDSAGDEHDSAAPLAS